MDITQPEYMDEDAARAHLEALRWPSGPRCPHCGSSNVTRLGGRSARPGTLQCNGCRRQFTVTVGTSLQGSKIPLHKWLLANHLMCASKSGISAHRMHLMLDVTHKSALVMCRRLRDAIRHATGRSLDEGATEAGESPSEGRAVTK